MKKLLSVLFLVLALGCTNSYYHVASVQSEQVSFSGKDLVFENEHLKVVYNFWEQGGRMRFLLFNKTDQPLYIDWSKSFLMRNDAKIAYSQLPALPKRTAIDTVRYMYQNTLVEPYRATARANPLTELAPQTFAAIADFPIQQPVEHKKTKEKLFTYTKENSPLRFGQQLAYSLTKTRSDAHQIDHSFWVNKVEVVRTDELIRRYGSRQKGRPNALYTVETRPATLRTVAVTFGIISVGSYIFVKTLFSDGLGFAVCC
ncbi:hypothetical protein [Spirosoma areae]